MPDASLDFRDRSVVFARLEAETFDLLVIGAGITGCGIARDAALRGLRVALIDANDIASGTSSRSSKLVHGGMRYLASGQVNVVKEAATERKTLRRIAPHLARTMPFIVPAPSRGAMLKLKAAMVAYEQLGEVDKAERHTAWDLDRLHAEEPVLRTEDLHGAIVYPEYLTDDARLTLANARSAAASGAAIATYAAVTDILVENGAASGAIVRSNLENEDLGARVRARIVVNAAGPWLDAVRKLEDTAAPAKLQLTKGIHVTVSRDRLPIRHTVIMQAADKRSTFVVPRGRFAYFGTTDTFYPEAEYWPAITRDDVDYLLACGARAFDTGVIRDADIVSLWSGVRPLLAQEGKNPSEISRRNETLEGSHRVLSIAGGKLTSYRSMAERIVDICEERLGRATTPCQTADEPLPGGNVEPDLARIEVALRDLGANEAEAERLARLYGAEAPDLAAKGLSPAVEAAWAVQHEGALTLEDYWARRSSRAHFDDGGGLDALTPAAEAMGALLGWDEAERERQVAACTALRAREMEPITAKGLDVARIDR